MTEVNVEYNWTDLAELVKDREIYAAARCVPHTSGTDVTTTGTNTRDILFKFETFAEAFAAVERLRKIEGVRAVLRLRK